MLVTGGAGFIGSNFIRYLLMGSSNWSVVNLDALTYAGNLLNFEDFSDALNNRYEFVHADIRDYAALTSLFSRYKFDAVIHFAAESHVDRSIVGPRDFIETNVNGTFNLLNVALAHWKELDCPDDFRFVHISTDEVYGSLGATGYFTEKTAYDPSSPYSASKAASDHLVKAYFRTYGLPTISTNCSNNFGPYQFPEKLIPLMILNIVEEKALPVYGDGKNVRDWLYVKDHCEAVLTVLEKGMAGETYNVGGSSEYRNIDIVYLLCDLIDRRLDKPVGESRELVTFVKDRPGHDRRYAIDAGKIRRSLGWSPRYNFEDAIKETIDWYLANMKWVESVRSGEYLKWIERNYGNRQLDLARSSAYHSAGLSSYRAD